MIGFNHDVCKKPIRNVCIPTPTWLGLGYPASRGPVITRHPRSRFYRRKPPLKQHELSVHRPSPMKIAVIGDSHARRLSVALRGLMSSLTSKQYHKLAQRFNNQLQKKYKNRCRLHRELQDPVKFHWNFLQDGVHLTHNGYEDLLLVMCSSSSLCSSLE